MTAFVTGGTGLVGVNLVRRLIDEGHRVRLLVRPGSPRVGIDQSRVEMTEGDVTDLASVRRAMSGCDRVYHIAGHVLITPWSAERSHAVNVVGTENVCQAALDAGVARLMHTSSIAAIGSGTRESPADENSSWNFGRLKSPYYDTKRQAENVVQSFIQRGLDAVIVNPSYIIGPWDVKPSSGRMILLFATRRLRWAPSRGGIGFVDVREVVDGMVAAMQLGKSSERYILSSDNLSYLEFGTKVARIAGVAPPRVSVPGWVLLPAAGVGSILGRHWPAVFADCNLTVLRTTTCEQYVSGEKACGALGIRHRPIDAAIADALDWFAEHDYVRRTRKGWKMGPGFER